MIARDVQCEIARGLVQEFRKVAARCNGLRYLVFGRSPLHNAPILMVALVVHGLGRVMFSINEAFIEAAAPNADAAKNGRGLVLKNKFLALHHSADDTLLFGRCQGSGQTAAYRQPSDAGPGTCS